MAFHEAQKWEAAQATLRGQAPCITLPRLLLTGVGGGVACVHSDPTGLQEVTSQHSFCLMVLPLGNWPLV